MRDFLSSKEADRIVQNMLVYFLGSKEGDADFMKRFSACVRYELYKEWRVRKVSELCGFAIGTVIGIVIIFALRIITNLL